MTDKSEALRLADALQQQAVWEGHYGPSYLRDLLPEAAAKLRRLHGLDFALRDCELALQKMATKYMDAVDQRDALLEALKEIEPILARMYGPQAANLPPMQLVRAAIARAEGEQK
jgi:hypothetical protein